MSVKADTISSNHLAELMAADKEDNGRERSK